MAALIPDDQRLFGQVRICFFLHFRLYPGPELMEPWLYPALKISYLGNKQQESFAEGSNSTGLVFSLPLLPGNKQLRQRLSEKGRRWKRGLPDGHEKKFGGKI